jgi:hypothetical protein
LLTPCWFRWDLTGLTLRDSSLRWIAQFLIRLIGNS